MRRPRCVNPIALKDRQSGGLTRGAGHARNGSGTGSETRRSRAGAAGGGVSPARVARKLRRMLRASRRRARRRTRPDLDRHDGRRRPVAGELAARGGPRDSRNGVSNGDLAATRLVTPLRRLDKGVRRLGILEWLGRPAAAGSPEDFDAPLPGVALQRRSHHADHTHIPEPSARRAQHEWAGSRNS